MSEADRGTSGLKRAWLALSQNGTQGLSLEEARKVRSLNQFVIIAIVSLVGYATVFSVTSAKTFIVPIVVNSLTAVAHVAELFYLRKRRYALAIAQFLVLLNAHIAFVTFWVGPSVGFHFYGLAFTTVVALVVPRRMAYFYPFAIVSAALFVYGEFFMPADLASVAVPEGFARMTKLVTVIATAGTLALIALLFDNDAHHAEGKLLQEHDRSERLLLNVLPASISERLKGGHQAIADGFADVSVLFADIVGFTELSARLPPAELVRVLSRVFSRFDDLADEHGLEKIKTIGDAYMVAAGLPVTRPDHAVAVTRMALRMISALASINEELGYELEVRIGVNSGPVVAGVIGKKKFIYDLWGDTVNTASRMESHGQKSAIHVTESTAALIEAEFELEPRGTIHVKGKGDMTTFFVVGEKKPTADRPPTSLREGVPSARALASGTLRR